MAGLFAQKKKKKMHHEAGAKVRQYETPVYTGHSCENVNSENLLSVSMTSRRLFSFLRSVQSVFTFRRCFKPPVGWNVMSTKACVQTAFHNTSVRKLYWSKAHGRTTYQECGAHRWASTAARINTMHDEPTRSSTPLAKPGCGSSSSD